jgi:hypothetical protein
MNPDSQPQDAGESQNNLPAELGRELARAHPSQVTVKIEINATWVYITYNSDSDKSGSGQ